jgi:sec-independent protein translocase protein TatA
MMGGGGPATGPGSKEIAVNLGPAELGIMLVIALVLFGGAKLPQLARSLGEARRELEGAAGPTPAEVRATTDERA